MTEKATKKKFKMPHLLWIMFGIILVASLATYIIPAGQYATNAEGQIDATSFSYLDHQTPVSPWGALLLVKEGMNSASTIMMVVMISGATINVVLNTGVMDDILNWGVYKLKDKQQNLLIALLMVLMAYLGGFGGTDALLAVVPIGVLLSNKLHLDPIVAVACTTFAALVGFGTGPAQQATTQMLMGVRPYSGFFTRLLIMNFFLAIAIIMTLRYVNKVKKDPQNSLMYDLGWRPNTHEVDESDLKDSKLSLRKVLILVVFIGQYIAIAVYPMIVEDGIGTFELMMALMLITMTVAGFLGGLSPDEIGKYFAQGLGSMAFVSFVIGLAKVISLVLANGNIIHTIVRFLTLPLMGLPRSISGIGLTIIVSIINPLIPSATSKAAILVPIVKPVAEALGMPLNLAVVSYQMGDSFTNLLSPLLGWMIGSLAVAKVPYNKWFKWVLPKVLTFIVLACVIIFLLFALGWQGTV